MFIGNIFSRRFVSNSQYGMPYLAASDTVLADLDTGTYLSKKQANQLKYLVLDKGWVLVTCSGTIGNVVYTNRDYCNHIASHDLLRIIPKKESYYGGILTAYLASKYGHALLTQGQFGAVVKHINEAFVGSLPIPDFPEEFQAEVDGLVQRSATLREQAASLLAQAKSALEEFIEMPFEPTKGMKTAVRSLKDIRNSLQTRLDPPALMYNSVLAFEKLTHRTKPLGECEITTWYPGMFKRVYVETGVPYIQSSSVFQVNPFRHCDHLVAKRTPKLHELWLKEGMLLVSCAGACGLVKLITKEYEDKGAIGSPDIIRLTSKDPLVTLEYLFTYLQLPIAQDYMQSFKYGSVIERFDAKRLESVPIIIPTPEISSCITAWIKTYGKNMYEAFCAEEKAISLVEAEIEKWDK